MKMGCLCRARDLSRIASAHSLMSLRTLAAQNYCSFSSFLIFDPTIANVQSEIQIVDTQKSIETRISIGFPAFVPQFNRTLLD